MPAPNALMSSRAIANKTRRIAAGHACAKDYLQHAESRLEVAILEYSRKQEALAAAARERAEAQMHLESERLLREREHQQSVAQAAERAAARATSEAQDAHSRGDLCAAELALDQARTHAALADEARETASAAMLSAQVLTLPQVTASPAKVEGLSGRTTYSVVVTDLMALVKSVASLQPPLECLCPDSKFLAAQARAMKRTGVMFPGIGDLDVVVARFFYSTGLSYWAEWGEGFGAYLHLASDFPVGRPVRLSVLT
jgi:hypothetical protein